jgi:hypothetical protein
MGLIQQIGKILLSHSNQKSPIGSIESTRKNTASLEPILLSSILPASSSVLKRAVERNHEKDLTSEF